jgi:NitT/TauT family transport system substrate-binding protein
MRRPLVALVAVALLGVVAGCGSDGDEAPAASGGTKQVKVGVIPILDVAPIYLGKEKGFFSNRGIELTMETGQGGRRSCPGWSVGSSSSGSATSPRC